MTAPWRAAQDAMGTLGIDALVVTGVAAQEAVGGHRRIRVFQSDPPGPGLALTRGDAPHVCTPDPDGARHLPADHVHPVAFDPTAFARALADRLGPAARGTIAVDRAAPGALALVATACPDATIVDADAVLARIGIASAPPATDAVLDDDGLVAPRRARAHAVAQRQGIDGWWLRTPEAIRLLTGRGAPALVGDTFLDDAGVDAALESLPRRGRIAVDRVTVTDRAGIAAVAPGLELVDAGSMLLVGSIPRAAPEIAALREGYLRTELAIEASRASWHAGTSERACSDALAHEGARLGLAPHIDHVVTVIERALDAVPWRRGEWADAAPWRQLTSDRVIADGELVGVDAGFFAGGYVTDFGATYLAGREATAAEHALARRWTAVADRVTAAVRPGASAADLRAAALDGWDGAQPPWPFGLYVAHGVGFGGVVPPFAGTDLGVDVERTMVLTPGDVLMIEPYVHEDGVGGFRAERCVAVTDSGPEVWTTLPIERLEPL